MHRICSAFVDKVNDQLSEPAILLDPPSFSEGNYNDGGLNLFQINLRGRILQIEFGPTADLYEDDDFRLPYVLRGAVRSFNQDQLDQGSVDEQMIFYCPAERGRGSGIIPTAEPTGAGGWAKPIWFRKWSACSDQICTAGDLVTGAFLKFGSIRPSESNLNRMPRHSTSRPTIARRPDRQSEKIPERNQRHSGIPISRPVLSSPPCAAISRTAKPIDRDPPISERRSDDRPRTWLA